MSCRDISPTCQNFLILLMCATSHNSSILFIFGLKSAFELKRIKSFHSYVERSQKKIDNLIKCWKNWYDFCYSIVVKKNSMLENVWNKILNFFSYCFLPLSLSLSLCLLSIKKGFRIFHISKSIKFQTQSRKWKWLLFFNLSILKNQKNQGTLSKFVWKLNKYRISLTF